MKSFLTWDNSLNVVLQMTWQVVEILSSAQLASASAISDEEVYFPKTVNDVAYLQYTSGSTSDPKGVMVTHQNYLHQVSYLSEFQCRAPSIPYFLEFKFPEHPFE